MTSSRSDVSDVVVTDAIIARAAKMRTDHQVTSIIAAATALHADTNTDVTRFRHFRWALILGIRYFGNYVPDSAWSPTDQSKFEELSLTLALFEANGFTLNFG